MRAFLAVELPEPVQASLASLQCQLAAGRADVTWVQPTNLHLTMRFLGEISDAQRQQIEAGARRIAAGMAPFHVSLGTPGAFPSMRAPRGIWVGMTQGHKQLTELSKGLEQESVAAGLQPVADPANGGKERGFVAHVTIGRARSPKRMEELSAALAATRWEPPMAFLASAVTFFQSTLRPDGRVYSVLAQLPFQNVSDT